MGDLAAAPVATIEASMRRQSSGAEGVADAHVPQCGYCQAGQIMQAAALLAAKRYRPMPRSPTYDRQYLPLRLLSAHFSRRQTRFDRSVT